MKQKILVVLTIVLFSTNLVSAQNPPEITVTLNEQFLNSFLDAVFNNLETPTFQLSKVESPKPKVEKVKFEKPKCVESITLLRETNGVRTSVRIADGKILTPLAFTGNYDVPFVGCTNFKGWAEADLNLEYDAAKGMLFGRIKVNKVDLNGVPGIAGGVVARFVQGSINKKINPLEILRAEQISAIIPVQYANGAIKLKATNMRTEVVGNQLNVRVSFEFSKAN
jgi:hypothetical protein